MIKKHDARMMDMAKRRRLWNEEKCWRKGVIYEYVVYDEKYSIF